MIQKLPLTLRRDTSGTCMVGIGGATSPPKIIGMEGHPDLPFGPVINLDNRR